MKLLHDIALGTGYAVLVAWAFLLAVSVLAMAFRAWRKYREAVRTYRAAAQLLQDTVRYMEQDAATKPRFRSIEEMEVERLIREAGGQP